MRRWLKRVVVRLTGNRPAQQLLHWNVIAAQYLMGIGSGALPEVSGERALGARLLIIPRPDGRPLRIVDVGANRGQFLDMITAVLGPVPVEIHAFEPAPRAFAALQDSWGGRADVVLNRVALGRAPGRADLFADAPDSPLASLSRREPDTGAPFTAVATVEVDTLDRYAGTRGLGHIDLLKVDVEGHELGVLEGAAGLLDDGRVGMVSFETGPGGVDARVFFRDLFRFLGAHGMGHVCRITPAGYLVPVSRYRVIHEQFRINYVAFRSPG